MRDLVRTRLDAVRALRRARQQLSGFLLRQGCHYGRLAWTKLMRGMALVNAATLIAELGDLSRFVNPRQLMAWPISDWCPRSIRAVPAASPLDGGAQVRAGGASHRARGLHCHG